jgi:hypothetical protein
LLLILTLFVHHQVMDMVTPLGIVPLDGEKLTAFFHGRGVNMRCLGEVVIALEKVDPVYSAAAEFPINLCKQEMIAREFFL